jgi:uncharacterized membrane protein YqgA involved in biofilm formation
LCALTGELLRIEDGVELIGEKLKARSSSGSSIFVQSFVRAIGKQHGLISNSSSEEYL